MRLATHLGRWATVATNRFGSRAVGVCRGFASLVIVIVCSNVSAVAQGQAFQQRPAQQVYNNQPTYSGQQGGSYQPNNAAQQRAYAPTGGGQAQPYSNAAQTPMAPMGAGGGYQALPSPNQPTHVAALPPQATDPASLAADGDGSEQSGSGSSLIASMKSQFDSLYSSIRTGGWLMLPLVICGLLVGVLTIERLWSLRRGRVIPRPFVRRFTECVEDGQLSFEEAQQICEEFSCPVAEVFQAAVKRWGRPMLEIEQAVIDAGDRVSERLSRFLRVFYAISNLAPLFGLLGTVLGMIKAFNALSEGSFSGAELLAAGIGQALVTTAAGLIVAIPAYLSYIYFTSVSDRYLNEIDRLCQRLIDTISAEGLESSTRSRRSRRAA